MAVIVTKTTHLAKPGVAACTERERLQLRFGVGPREPRAGECSGSLLMDRSVERGSLVLLLAAKRWPLAW